MNEARGGQAGAALFPAAVTSAGKPLAGGADLHFKGLVSVSFLRPSAVVGMSLAWSEDVEYRARGWNAACHRDSRTHRSPRELMLRWEIRTSRHCEVLRKHVGAALPPPCL